MNASTLRRVALAGLLSLTLSRSLAITFSANFDSLSPSSSVSSGYTEGGIQFTSPSSFGVATGNFGAVIFGWGGYTYAGNALYVHNNGWVGISAPGYAIDSVAFKYGFDWNGYTIEYGLMDTMFGWKALYNGAIVDSGSQTWGRENRTHGGIALTVDPLAAFDTLLIRSTAVEYQGIYQTVPQPPGYWYYERGDVLGYGDANHIAFDNVSVTTTPIPDGTASIGLFAFAVAALMRFSRRFVV